MPSWVILFWKDFSVPVLLKAIWTVYFEFLFVPKTTLHYSLALLVWYWPAYSSRFSLWFILNLGRWVLFLCLSFSLFKCLLIVLVLHGPYIRDFYIFDVDDFFSFLLHEPFLSWIVVLTFLAWQSVFSSHSSVDF